MAKTSAGLLMFRLRDGEPEVLPTPIEFRIEPRALRVLVPDGR